MAIKLNVTIDNYKEVLNIIDKLYSLTAIPFFNDNSLTILNITLYNYEEVVDIIDKLYRVNAIRFYDWSLTNLQLLNLHIYLTSIKTAKV